jgi:hypothetical protein
MLRIPVKSAVTLLVVALFSVGAAQPEGCASLDGGSGEGALPLAPVVGGNFFITGHAADFEAVTDAAAGRLLLKALAFVREGNPKPFLFVEARITPPAGHRAGKDGLRAVGLVEGRDFLHLDAAQLAAQPRPWWDALSANFSAIVVASDRALLTQAELDQLNYHRGDIARFMRENRGVLAFSEGGSAAHLTQRDRYEFLPIPVWNEASALPPYSVTVFGEDVLGLSDEEVNTPAYNHFDGDFGYEVITISDANGDIIALAGEVVLNDRFLYVNAGPDATFYGPGEDIEVTLDGSGTVTDPASYPLFYTWLLGDSVLVETTEPVVTVTLPPGEFEITLIVRNRRNSEQSDELVVTVVSVAAPPTIICPANVAVSTSPHGVCGAPVSYPAPAVSAPNGVASVSCTPASGSAFPLGDTTVGCTVVDKTGQSASCSFTVTVNDREPPTLVPPPPTSSEADASCRSTLPSVVGDATASDNCTPAGALVITQTPAPGTQVTGAGTYTIQLKTQDAAGNTATATTTHTVIDVTPPTLGRVTPSKTTLWPPNHKLVPISIGVTLSDNCGDTTTATQCQVTNVTSNEPINGRGDGNTDWDWEITGPLGLMLRAERAGLLNSRIYTIWVVCTDPSGASTTGTTTVTVPHDQRGK